MRILDLDLDFFLDGITWKYGAGNRFPDEGSHPPWSEERVRHFLEDGCGLSTASPVPGKVVTTHDKVLWEWLELSRDGQEWDVVHVDAHGDLGYGDMCLVNMLKSFLSTPLEQRVAEVERNRSSVNEGCYLLYALAFGKMSKLTYVHPNEGVDDVPEQIMKGFDLASGEIELRLYDLGEYDPIDEDSPVLAVEPAVPFDMVRESDFKALAPFDYIFLAQSPAYTPESADPLIEVVRDYMKPYS